MYCRAKFAAFLPQLDVMHFSGEDDIDTLSEFCGRNWSRADSQEMSWPHACDDAQVVVYNSVLQQWLYLPDGHYLVRGLHGEIWPVDSTTFEEIFVIPE